MRLLGLFLALGFFSLNASAIKITSLSDINGNELLITEIDLSNQGLVEFPEKILACKNLQSLTLTKNGFVNVPIELGMLENLTKLDISENQNVSPLDLVNLFDSCQFRLEELNISDCALFFLPEGVAKQNELVRLDISSNYIKVLPYMMMRMYDLEYANFSNNSLRNISWLSSKWWSLKEIDVSGNQSLEGEGLLMNLSYLDKIEKVTIGNLSAIPEAFKYFMGKEITIKNSVIPDFPRHKYSSKIDRISFVNCFFTAPEKVIAVLNENGPDRLSFRRMEPAQLMPFLSVNVDSLDLRDNNLTTINPIVEMEEVKWVDIRANDVTKSSLRFVGDNRPDIELYVSEPIEESIGVSPPFPGMEPQAEIVKINSQKSQTLSVGKTVFDIPEQAFLTASGEVYEGSVSLEYTEYFTPEDIFLSGITMTTSYEDEPYMLSSGGMFNIEAKDDKGNELQTNPNQPIDVQVISPSDNPDMQLWQMNDDGAWEDEGLDNMLEIFKIDSSKLDSIMATDYAEVAEADIEFVRDRYVPYVKKGDRLKDFEIKFHRYRTYRSNKKLIFNGNNIQVNNREYHSEYLAGLTLVYDGDSSEYHKEALAAMGNFCKNGYKKLRDKSFRKSSLYYTKEGPNYVSKLTLIPDYENDNLDLKFVFKDSLVNLPVVFKTRTYDHNAEPREIGSYFTRYQYNYKKYVKEKRRNFFKIKPFINRVKNQLKAQAYQAELNRQQNVLAQSIANPNMVGNGSVQRNFPLRSFGLWNCDARSRMRAPGKIAQHLVNAEGGTVKDDINMITLVDRSKNGVLNFASKESAFFDRKSKNVIIFFFAGGAIGVFRSWINNIKGDRMDIKMMDVNPESKGDIKAILKSKE